MGEVTTNADALAQAGDNDEAGQYTAKIGQDIIKGWNDRRRSSNVDISGLTPFVQLIGLFNPKEIEKMFSFDITSSKRKVYFDDGQTPSSLGDPQPDDPEKPDAYEDIQKQLTARSINVYFSGSNNPEGRGAPIQGIILAETRSQADPTNYKGGVGINDLQIDYGKSSAVGSRTYKLRMTINDPQLLNDHVEYSKLATMNGEFVILYGWTNPRAINGFDSLPVPSPEPDPAQPGRTRIVIPLNGAGTGGYWQAAKANILSYDFSFNEMGHIEIAVSMLDKTSLALATQKVGPLAAFMKTGLGVEQHNSQGQETGQPDYPSGQFDQIMITLKNGEAMTIADAIKSNQEDNKRLALEHVLGVAGYTPLASGDRLLGSVGEEEVDNIFSMFGLTVDQIDSGAQDATPAESQNMNMQEHIRRDKEKQLKEFPFAGTGIRVYEKVSKYVPMTDSEEIDEDTGEVPKEEIAAYNIKTTHYYMGWILEMMKLGMQDVNKHKTRMGESPAIPNFTYLDNPDADQISNVFQSQQSAKQHGPMSQRIQDAIIRLKEKCIPPFRARMPDHDVVAVVGKPSNAQGSPLNFETSPCKNKIVIENIHELMENTSKNAQDLLSIIKERAGIDNSDIQAMEAPKIEGESFRGHVFEATVDGETVRSFIPDTNFDPADPTAYDITKSRLYDPNILGDSDDHQGILEASAAKAKELGYVGDIENPESVVRGKFFFFLRCEWKKEPEGAGFVGAITAVATGGGLSPLGLVAGGAAGAAYKEYWKSGNIVGKYKIMDPDNARMYVNWELIQRKWYNIHVKSITTHMEQLIYKRIGELEAEGRTVEEIYNEPIDLDWLTGYNFNWNALTSSMRIKTYDEIKGQWQDTDEVANQTSSVQQRISEYDKDIEDIQLALEEVGNNLRNKLNFIERQKEAVERKAGGRFDRTRDFEDNIRRGDVFYKFVSLYDMMANGRERQEERTGSDDQQAYVDRTTTAQRIAARDDESYIPPTQDETLGAGIPIKGESTLLSYDDDNDEPPFVQPENERTDADRRADEHYA